MTPYCVASTASERLYVSPQRPAMLYDVAAESAKLLNAVRTAVPPKSKLIGPMVCDVVIVVSLHGCSSVKVNVCVMVAAGQIGLAKSTTRFIV